MTSASLFDAPEGDASRGTRGDRLRQARTHLGKTQEEMGQLVGVSGRSWQDYEAEAAVPKVPVYERLAALGFEPVWLIGGGGEPVVAQHPAHGIPLEGGRVTSAETPPMDGYVALPRYDVRAAAGVGVPVLTEEIADFIYFKVDWLRRTIGLAPTQLALIEAVGDSMNPTIHDGDLLLLDVSDPKLRGDGIYVIGEGDALVVKRIALRLGGRGMAIRSDNERYSRSDLELSQDELSTIRLVGRVVWVGGRV